MRARSKLLAPLVALAVSTVAGCGGGGTQQNDTPDAQSCASDSRAMTYTVGMAQVGSGAEVTFKLMSVSPAPPMRNDNTWQVDLVDGNGDPIEGAVMTATPFMPDHGHGTPIKAVVTEPSPGHYDIEPLNLWMPGIWQVTLDATPQGGTKDQAVFTFCIEA
jgi:YtkA-like